MRGFKLSLIVGFVALLLSTVAWASFNVPKIQGMANDYANVLKPSEKADLEKKLNTFREQH